MSSLKLFGQLLIIGGQVVGKIVSSAYKQALSNAAKNPNLSSGAGGSSVSNRGAMSVDEATKILNCPKNCSKDELVSRFEHLFKVNDRKSGGSFYLQSKIVRAREALESQLKAESKTKDTGKS